MAGSQLAKEPLPSQDHFRKAPFKNNESRRRREVTRTLAAAVPGTWASSRSSPLARFRQNQTAGRTQPPLDEGCLGSQVYKTVTDPGELPPPKQRETVSKLSSKGAKNGAPRGQQAEFAEMHWTAGRAL
ncbi:hypothetical protein AAFF_G00199280 [Aldrovandia affinis]|uniref:Uncharacterized protein n=1 Tax=Aldrovandia affinis TaxID=143900 RepID=A0AAD7RII2_9TELE|nr:hypothetical protein AAFF_G00199280 [Aldrovandia affinis]